MQGTIAKGAAGLFRANGIGVEAASVLSVAAMEWKLVSPSRYQAPNGTERRGRPAENEPATAPAASLVRPLLLLTRRRRLNEPHQLIRGTVTDGRSHQPKIKWADRCRANCLRGGGLDQCRNKAIAVSSCFNLVFILNRAS